MNDLLNKLKTSLGLTQAKPLSPVSKMPNLNPVNQTNAVYTSPTSQGYAPSVQGVSTPSSDYVSPIPGFVPAGNRKPNIPSQYVNLINQAAKQYGVEPALVAAHIQHESAGTWNPKINGPTGDYGLAQIVLSSHPDVTLSQAYDPSFAIPFIARYLANSMKKFGDINRTIASYNVGQGGASIQGPEPAGTGPRGQDYIDRVANNLSPELRKKLGIKTRY